MRTNIDIDNQLLAKAAEALGTKTKKATVQAALELVVGERQRRRRQQRRILELRGQVEWIGDLDEMQRSRDYPR